MVAEAAAFIGVGAKELSRVNSSSDEEGGGSRKAGGRAGGGIGGGKRRRTNVVMSGASVASGSVQMGFEGGCYVAAQVGQVAPVKLSQTKRGT